MNIDLGFLVKLFLRRIHIFILVALPVAVASAWFAFALPASYTAEARLLVESPQMPQEMAASTIRADAAEVLQVIQQRLLTRNNMLELSRRFGLHSDQPRMSPDAIVSDMRRRVSIRVPGPRDRSSVLTVSFNAERPDLSADVTNALVTQILRENVALRTAVVTQTLAFFDEELERLNEEMSLQTDRILEFKRANREALPEGLAFLRARQATLQERLAQTDRELASLRDRRERLIDVYERTGRIEGGADALTAEQRQLQDLRTEKARALVVFSPENPRLRAMEAQIKALEEVVAAQMGASTEALAGMSPLDLQLTDIDAQMEFLADQKASVEGELEAMAAAIEATPQNAVVLESLERDYQNLQAQYDRAVERRAQARIGERIEAQSRGHRITVLEQAVAPELPSRPNRRAIAMAGAGGGLALGFLMVALLILMNRAVLRPADLRAQMGVVPFGAVPYFRTRREILWRRGLISTAVLVIAAGIPAGLWWVDQYYLPLEFVMGRISERTGIDTLINTLRGAG